jgi:seryl-tRNA synthetase
LSTVDLNDAYEAYRDQLLAAGLLVATGVEGLYGRNAEFESIVAGLNRCVDELARDDHPEAFAFPPLISRTTYELTDHLRSFPDLMGAIDSFEGGDAEHKALVRSFEAGDDWATQLSTTDLMLCPAACYPLYPMLTGTALPPQGRLFDVIGFCFRHEPSPDPARMQIFRQHENVFVGAPADAVSFRDRWIERGLALLGSLGLDVRAEVANDPFFGRAGRMLKSNQREAELKYEIVTPICSTEKPTAIASCNCHLDHLAAPFRLSLPDGTTAHSACVGFGLERCALALLMTHGLQTSSWPASVRSALWP